MLANPMVLTLNKPALELTLLLYSPDESNAQRFSARLRHLAELTWCDSSRFSASRKALDEQQPRLVLLDFSRDHIEASTEIARKIAAVAPDLLLVGIGSASADRGVGVLGAMRAGLKDFIDIDTTDDELLAQLSGILDQSRQGTGVQLPGTPRRGQLVLLCGVRPGLGASTLAAHLGTIVAGAKPGPAGPSDAANHVLLLDLGQSRGDIGLYLGTHSDFHFEDALRHAGRIDATLVRTALPHHTSGATVLGQPRGCEGSLRGAEVAPLMERLLSMYDLVLCDLDPRALDEVSESLLKVADEIWLLVDQTIGTMVSLDSCLQQLERAHARDLRVSLVVNRYDEACGIPSARMAERFNHAVLATLPERSRALRASANQGALLHDASPNDAYVRALVPLLARFRLRVKHAVGEPPWKRLINRLGESLWKRH
jgi:pilus assembly protein CpaE